MKMTEMERITKGTRKNKKKPKKYSEKEKKTQRK